MASYSTERVLHFRQDFRDEIESRAKDFPRSHGSFYETLVRHKDRAEASPCMYTEERTSAENSEQARKTIAVLREQLYVASHPPGRCRFNRRTYHECLLAGFAAGISARYNFQERRNTLSTMSALSTLFVFLLRLQRFQIDIFHVLLEDEKKRFIKITTYPFDPAVKKPREIF